VSLEAPASSIVEGFDVAASGPTSAGSVTEGEGFESSPDAVVVADASTSAGKVSSDSDSSDSDSSDSDSSDSDPSGTEEDGASGEIGTAVDSSLMLASNPFCSPGSSLAASPLS
jgi:hypothetical protein